jgi:hypothetical protein
MRCRAAWTIEVPVTGGLYPFYLILILSIYWFGACSIALGLLSTLHGIMK